MNSFFLENPPVSCLGNHTDTDLVCRIFLDLLAFCVVPHLWPLPCLEFQCSEPFGSVSLWVVIPLISKLG